MAKVRISLYAPNTFDNVLLTECSSFTSEQKDKLVSASQTDGYYNLRWADFDGTSAGEVLILANFLEDINSSSSPLGVLKGYEVQKREYGDNYWRTAYSNDNLIVGGDADPISYVLYDYNIKNNTYYYYRVIPLVLNGMGNYSDEKCILTGWETFSLMPLQITQNSNDVGLKVATPAIYNEDGTPQVWKFVANCEEGSLTKVQDKTYFNNFTKFPKVNIGKASYFTIPFSGLLGTIDENLNYYEPNDLLEKWNKFVDGGYICLYKNLKGDARIVSIDSDSTNTYANAYDYYIGDKIDINGIKNDKVNIGDDPDQFNPTYITNRPTTISINLTEIDDANNYEIIRLEGKNG